MDNTMFIDARQAGRGPGHKLYLGKLNPTEVRQLRDAIERRAVAVDASAEVKRQYRLVCIFSRWEYAEHEPNEAPAADESTPASAMADGLRRGVWPIDADVEAVRAAATPAERDAIDDGLVGFLRATREMDAKG